MKRFHHKFRQIILTGVFILGGAGMSTVSADEIKVGLLLSQTGPLATYGTTMKAAAEYATKIVNDQGGINGKKVTLLTEDDASRPGNFLNGLNRLVDHEKVHALIGPITSGLYLAAVPIIKESGTVMISPTATAPELTRGAKQAFRNNPSEDTNIPVLLEFIKSAKPDIKTISVIYDNKEAADKIIGQLYEELAPKIGWELLNVTTFLSGQLNYGDVVSKALQKKPDVVAVAAHAEDAANVARELRRQGYEGSILGGTSTVSQDYFKIGADAADDTYVVVPYHQDAESEANKAFVDGYSEFTGRTDFDPWEASTYESISMVFAAMANANLKGGDDNIKNDRNAIQQSLAETKDFPGLIGPIHFDDERVAVKPAVILHSVNNRWQALDY